MESSPWHKLVVGAGGVLILVFGAFLFANRGNDTTVIPASGPAVESVTDPETTSGTEDQAVADSEQTSGTGDQSSGQSGSGEGQPISSGHVADPAGDNGGNGTGADILGLEYVQADTFTVLLQMGFSPLESSVIWFSYYLEVTLIRLSGAIHVLIWENHAGSSRSGELDSSGNANEVGVELSDESASFQVNADPDDPVVEIRVVAFSLVKDGDTVTEDRMTAELG